MLKFSCPNCETPIFFNTFNCLSCGSGVAFDSKSLSFVVDNVERRCQNRTLHQLCNWEIEGAGPFCLACLSNSLIPDLTVMGNLEKWKNLEESKKRLYYDCLRLGINTVGVNFRFVASTLEEPGVTGHCNGTITLNVTEADPVIREMNRMNLQEKFRTLIGHFRHEFGHYFWEDRVRNDGPSLERFRQVFGDERQDYQASLCQHYAGSHSKGQEFISVYASSHPWEDWAETFAHYLHLRDVLETAASFGLSNYMEFEFGSGIEEWIRLSVAFNEINRSMGLPDLYPFALTAPVIEKLRCVDDMITRI